MANKQIAAFVFAVFGTFVRCSAETASVQRRPLLAHDGPVTSLMFSPKDGSLASASADDGTIKLWDLQTGEPRTLFISPSSDITDLQISEDGSTLAAALGEDGVRLWPRLDETDLIERTCQGFVSAVGLNSKGDQLLAATSEGYAYLFHAKNATRTGAFAIDVGIRDMIVLDDFQTIATVGPLNRITSWGIRNGHCVRHSKGDRARLECMAVSSDRSRIAIGSRNGDVLIRSASSLQKECDLKAHEGEVTALGFVPDSNILITVGSDSTVCIIATEICRVAERRRTPGIVTSLAFSRNAQLLATGHDNGAIVLWDLTRKGLPLGFCYDRKINYETAMLYCYSRVPIVCALYQETSRPDDASFFKEITGTLASSRRMVQSQRAPESPGEARRMLNRLSDERKQRDAEETRIRAMVAWHHEMAAIQQRRQWFYQLTHSSTRSRSGGYSYTISY